MTPEARLDRLERIAKLFVKAGLRARRNMRELDEKFNMLVGMQINNEERFARNEERFAQTDRRFAETDRRFAETDRRFAQLADAQARTDRNLAELIEIVRKGRNGNLLAGNS